MKNLLDISLEELKQFLKENQEKPFRATQVFDYLKNGIFDFSGMKNIGEKTRSLLTENFKLFIPEVLKTIVSKDGTKKALLRLDDNHIIETVLMKYSYGYSVCISTQVGCRMGCSFCASTKEGLIRNLTPGEMLGQIIRWQMQENIRVSNVVLMGAGEPLDNFENVTKFIELVTSPTILNIGQRHLTISTCGLADRIKDFADLDNQVTLAISLHETNDEDRKKMMPVAYKYSLDELFKALSYYQKKTNRRITFEYALVKNINDTQEKAKELVNLVKGLKSHVNLIPLNETEGSLLKKPDMGRVAKFQKILNDNNLETTVRIEKGADIMAACGQLKRSYLSEEMR